MIRTRLLNLGRLVRPLGKYYEQQCSKTILIKHQDLSIGLPKFYSSLPTFTEIPSVFERIKQVSTPGIVKKVNAVYLFDVEGEGRWYVDLTTGSGTVGQGDPAGKPDVTVTVNKENFLKMFNRELKPATAFMSGRLKLSGDLSKALALESVMKASRDENF